MRAGIDKILIFGGLFLVVLQAVLLRATPFELGWILFGVFVAVLGLWGLGARIKPERRVYLQLRAEVEYFLTLVRRINKNAVDGDGVRANEVKEEMHESVEKIALAAGVESEV